MQSVLDANARCSAAVNSIQSYNKSLLANRVPPEAIDAAVANVLAGVRGLEEAVAALETIPTSLHGLLDSQKRCAKGTLQSLQLRREHAVGSLVSMEGMCSHDVSCVERHCQACVGYLAVAMASDHPYQEDDEEDEDVCQQRSVRCRVFSDAIATLREQVEEHRERIDDILSEM